ncbi:centromere protein L isoform X1 [Nothobranchius furzeri]|uniref:Centromere protein L n=1 Tax=Nothobranchius furzeri TaxID=105023 RepID=A0A9D2Y8W9_NOTFU|nr:centromere protein L isoform X1 [Nothobranchius furzeri]KAF7214939.1 transcript variant X1 [Nothobranchius furzeri]
MERPQTRRTPLSGGVEKRMSKSRSYRLSLRSCVSSRLGLTPGWTTRRLNSKRKAPKSQNITNQVSPDHLALLVKHEWQLSYVSPLYHFRHTQLKSYARQLSAFIAAEKQQGLAVEVGIQDSFKVSFSGVQGLAVADDDPETVLIQVHTKPVFAQQDDPLKLVWSGWLTCCNGSPEYLHSLPKDFTCLPLFGSSGAQNLTSLVKSWFQKNFDCSFGPLEINHTSLEWLVALWTNCNTETNIQNLKMLWTLPVEPPLQVTYVVEGNDAWDLWSSLQQRSEGDGGEEAGWIGIEEVTAFMQGLKNHFYRHFRLELSAGNLSQVSTSLGSAKCNGKIKVSNSRYMITTLTLLTECALLKMPV